MISGYTIAHHILFPPTHLRPWAYAARINSALDLSAAAATAGSSPSLLTPAVGLEPPRPAITDPGPFNPAASLSPKVVKRILELEFVEMSEMTVDDDTPQTPGRPPAPARLPITVVREVLTNGRSASHQVPRKSSGTVCLSSHHCPG